MPRPKVILKRSDVVNNPRALELHDRLDASTLQEDAEEAEQRSCQVFPRLPRRTARTQGQSSFSNEKIYSPRDEILRPGVKTQSETRREILSPGKTPAFNLILIDP